MTATDRSWIESATARLQESGRRAGGARSEVIAQLAKETCAVSAEQIELSLVGEGRKVGKASIYRALETLAAIGLVQKVDLGEGGSRWERIGSDPHHHHHHLLCRACGSVVPFEDENLERALHSLGEKNGLTVESHDVTLHGLCRECGTMQAT
jgi:Fur family ferric uptake transcriptional regulator